MTVTLKTLEVTIGQFKGRIIKTFDMPTYVVGLSQPWLSCFDDDGNYYAMFWGDVKEISREEVEVPEEIAAMIERGDPV